MKRLSVESYRVAIPKTVDGNGIAEAIYVELEKLGHKPFYFPLLSEVPAGTDVVFLFGPFGKFLHLPRQFAGKSRRRRPTFVFWNTEGLPDLRLPPGMAGALGLLRSWYGRLSHFERSNLSALVRRKPFNTLDSRFLRFRYLGDYLYANQQGWVDVFADISSVYAGYLRQLNLPTIFAPFGSSQAWYADLHLDRDIDVLWMGKRGTRRRSEAIDKLREELRSNGVEIYMVDNVEHPYVYNEERTELLNRTKITLNLLRTWYDENSLRICMAAPNRSMIMSEPLLPHVPEYLPGVHYAVAPLENMAKMVVHFLEHPEQTKSIVENAHQLTTSELTFSRSMQIIMNAAHQARQGSASPEPERRKPFIDPLMEKPLISGQGRR